MPLRLRMHASEGPESLLNLAHLLRSASSDDDRRVALSFSDHEWPALIRTAKTWGIIGSVYLAFQQFDAQSHVPAQWRKYCTVYHELRKARNRRLLSVATDVSRQGQRLGFPCLLLKGAAMLAIGKEEILG